jgi:hypothetical protein
MKWLAPNGSTQRSADHKYAIVQATEENWIAYAIGPTAGQQIGSPADTPERARALCEERHNMLVSQRRA